MSYSFVSKVTSANIIDAEKVGIPIEIGNLKISDKQLDSVFVRYDVRTVREVVERMETNQINLNPLDQDKTNWDTNLQSKLIESCILRIPISEFLMVELNEGQLVVIDGYNRLKTLTDFINDKFAINGLSTNEFEGRHPLDGLKFSDLSLKRQERIANMPMKIFVIEQTVPVVVLRDIFKRMDSNSKLSGQETRQILFKGPATRWINTATEDEPIFGTVAKNNRFGNSGLRKREVVNHFVAFKLLGWENYTNGDMQTFLAKGLRRLNNLSVDARIDLHNDFSISLSLNSKFFGKQAFRESMLEENPNASGMNLQLFEIFSVIFSEYDRLKIEKHKSKILQKVSTLAEDRKFLRSIDKSAESTISVHYRFKKLNDLMRSLIS